MYFNNTTEAETLLFNRFGITATLSQADLELAHQSLKRMGPFIGSRYDSSQADDFPRSITLEGDTEGQSPEAVLDFVALRAATLAQANEITPLSSSSKGLDVLRRSENYSRPKMSKVESYLRNTMARLNRYRVRVGTLI